MRRRSRAATCRIAAIASPAVFVLVACGHTAPVDSYSHPADAPAPLNSVSAQQVIGAITKAGLPALNSRDVTAEECPKLHCAQAIRTDTVSVYKFPATGLAQNYAASMSNDFQVEDLVLVFAPSVTAGLKGDYENVAARAVI